jgi:hypothetical protein
MGLVAYRSGPPSSPRRSCSFRLGSCRARRSSPALGSGTGPGAPRSVPPSSRRCSCKSAHRQNMCHYWSSWSHRHTRSCVYSPRLPRRQTYHAAHKRLNTSNTIRGAGVTRSLGCGHVHVCLHARPFAPWQTPTPQSTPWHGSSWQRSPEYSPAHVHVAVVPWSAHVPCTSQR